MNFDSDVFRSFILKTDLFGALSYIKQFPEKRELFERYRLLFEEEKYISYDADEKVNEILLAYQQYYRDVFYLCIDKERAEGRLRLRLIDLLGVEDRNIKLCDLEQTLLVDLFHERGLYFLGGKTGGCYGPYVWRTVETVSYDVELPDRVQRYSVNLLDGFLMRSWVDYLTFGEMGTGGWANGDGCINCVRSSWDLDSESFRVSLLKHEAQHVVDLEADKDMSSENLEYRAKLVELIYSCERNLLQEFARVADASDRHNGHAMAAYRIMKNFSNALGVDAVDPSKLSVSQIQSVAKELFDRDAR